ncbi:MAG: hypothetical protein R6W78_14665 [Bacteroidales bacterium]
MKYLFVCFLVCTIACTQNRSGNKVAPLSISPDNSNYFVYKDKPVLLLSSTEHYFALVNQKFDYASYIDYLQSRGFNVASVMSGIFLEPSGNKQWEDLVIPWQRSSVEGYNYGGNKFDLSKWNEDYFDRLEKFVAYAYERDIFVNYIFFSTFFDDHKWRATPFNPVNNVNTEYEKIQPIDVYTLDKHLGLLDLQKELIKKVTQRLKNYPNVIYEVTFRGDPFDKDYRPDFLYWTDYDWYQNVFSYLYESMDEPKQPIAFNVGKVRGPLNKVFENASAISYRFTDETMFEHVYGKGLPVFMGEHSFVPNWEPFVRRHAYRTVLSGCGIYTQIDFTYNARYPVGNRAPSPRARHGGGPEVHLGIEALGKVMNDCDFVKMLPNKSLVSFNNALFESAALENPGNEYLAYISVKPATINYKVIYKGFIKPLEEGWHHIKANTRGTIKFTLANRLVAQSTTSGHQNHTERIWYNGKDPIPFELESTFNSYNDEARIFIGLDSLYGEVLTKERLLCTDKRTPGVEATYYTGEKLDEKRVWRIEETLHNKVVNPSPFVEENQVRKTSFNINLPAGKYHCQWINAQTASVINEFELEHAGGQHLFRTPVFIFDILLKVKKIES